MHNTLWGGLEAGGTKFVCMVASGPDAIKAETRIPTTTPEETIGRAAAFFREQSAETPLAAIGVASFGPVDLNPGSPTYGHITTTPKPGWANADILGRLRDALDLPAAFETDVNAAAYGEYRWGAAQGLDAMVYLTIGTGIGAGIIYHGSPVHGLVHPEIGHMLIPHDERYDPFPGSCPYHGDCFEGLASGPALAKRWGQPGETLADDHPAWELEAHHIGQAVTNIILAYSPRRIVLGGGVMQRTQLLPLIREKVQRALNGYVQSPQITGQIKEYIVSPLLGNRAGVLGAVALAMDFSKRRNRGRS